MPKSDYLSPSDEGKAGQFERFSGNIGIYSTILELNPLEVASQAADAKAFRYFLNYAVSMEKSGSQWISYKNALLRSIGTSDIPVTPLLTLPVPPLVAFGIIKRFRKLVAKIRAHKDYLPYMGVALGIIGPDHVALDQADVTPFIKAEIDGGRVKLSWIMGDQEALEIEADHSVGSFSVIATSLRSFYFDPTAFPTLAATWLFRGMFVKDSVRIGRMSNVARINVGGV